MSTLIVHIVAFLILVRVVQFNLVKYEVIRPKSDSELFVPLSWMTVQNGTMCTKVHNQAHFYYSQCAATLYDCEKTKQIYATFGQGKNIVEKFYNYDKNIHSSLNYYLYDIQNSKNDFSRCNCKQKNYHCKAYKTNVTFSQCLNEFEFNGKVQIETKSSIYYKSDKNTTVSLYQSSEIKSKVLFSLLYNYIENLTTEAIIEVFC
jgi:hypothetical protein